MAVPPIRNGTDPKQQKRHSHLIFILFKSATALNRPKSYNSKAHPWDLFHLENVCLIFRIEEISNSHYLIFHFIIIWIPLMTMTKYISCSIIITFNQNRNKKLLPSSLLSFYRWDTTPGSSPPTSKHTQRQRPATAYKLRRW